ncbi:hypothetical protein KM043_011402 [Ampulex compressa]|nr:hypothetical protein KM043_011402 [Ampulex compressa]
MSKEGKQNLGFIGDDGRANSFIQNIPKSPTTKQDNDAYNYEYGMPGDKKKKLSLPEEMSITENTNERATWGNGLEFLMSCIAMSIGLGNVWRFPFTAYQNGGGAFLIPYIIVLFLVGKPFYYLEMIMGQFTSRSSVKMWSAVPGFRGVGWAQMFSMCAVGTYYCSLMSVTLYYLIGSFQSQLPWSTCLLEWGDTCVDSGTSGNVTTRNGTSMRSSAELYFTKTVLKEKLSIDDGLGMPDWKLTGCLLVAWCCIFLVLIRGVKSSGKAAYFLAIFPYIIMIALLVRAVTLEGAVNGIVFFIKPNWEKLFEPNVWYAAVTQCFFSLSVCFGGVVMYSSYNDFNHNIYRDVIVVTTLDTFTSLIAGFTIFGILGNLAHELGTDDISNVVRGGTGLAFVSYPDAIAKFTVLPQLFSVLFFLMLYVLGIGSGIALAGGIITIICDQFPTCKHWHVVFSTALVGFCLGTVYCTPGGQFILGLVDYYAGSFIVFVLATLEITGVFWIYGLENFLDDIEYMLKRRPSIYWRICWSIITPVLLIAILIYTIVNLQPLTYSGILYPVSAYAAGWTLLAFGVLQIPFWLIYTIVRKRSLGMPKMISTAFKPSSEWGPKNHRELASWREFKDKMRKSREKPFRFTRKQARLHRTQLPDKCASKEYLCNKSLEDILIVGYTTYLVKRNPISQPEMPQMPKYDVSNGVANRAFAISESARSVVNEDNVSVKKERSEREQWGNNKEFLFSCIAMSVGLGNIWRFPFTAYENGGGAFLIPYIIILFVVGKPFYLLEMILGQFSSRSSLKVWDLSPAFRGIGIIQFIMLVALASYYCSLMALTLFYLIASFQAELPWGKCRPEWGKFCVNSQPGNNTQEITDDANTSYISSAELYFYKEVLREKANVDDGIGVPDWRLVISLFISWITVFVIVVRGVKSSGKAAYFLAIFPYVVLTILLIRAVTLEGASNGILYFITPNWEKLWTSEVWYHAVAQCFFSLNVCFGAVVMFASYNKFDHDVYRDALIVTTLDTCTSLLAGFTIFGILGNLSHELKTKDINAVVRGGTGLAFISYPETIAKFTYLPQFFGVLFFVMIFVLGTGSEVGLTSSIISIIQDQFPTWKYWHIAVTTCTFEFLIGLIYVTPGGQFMVTFVDFYATSFTTFIPAACEMICISWAYGLNNILEDIEFMLKRRLSIFWKLCWSVITPGIIILIFTYKMINLELLKYNNTNYPYVAYAIGWIMFSVAILLIPLWIIIELYKNRHYLYPQVIKRTFQPSKNWGPKNVEIRRKWQEFKGVRRIAREGNETNGVFSITSSRNN